MEKTKESISKILGTVSTFYSVKTSDLKGRSRNQMIVKARFICMTLLFQSGLSYAVIAKIFNRDHSSVIYAVQKTTTYWKSDLEKFSMDDFKIDLHEIKNPYTQRPKRWKHIYEAYGGKCAICGFSSIVQVHHIIPRSIGGSDAIENLIVLCPNHHALLHLGLVDISSLPTLQSHVIPTPSNSNSIYLKN